MKIRIWLRSKKYDAKVWNKNHTAHIWATVTTLGLIAMIAYFGGNALADWHTQEFIEPLVYSQKLSQ